MTAPDDPLVRARSLDAADPLSRFVEAYHPAADGPAGRTIYLAGHVLGQQPHATANAVDRELRRWRQDLTAGWAERWNEIADLLAGAMAPIVGATPESLLVGPSSTIAMHQLAGAALGLRTNRPDVVVSEADPPALLYAMAQRVEQAGGTLRVIGAGPTPGMVSQAIDESVGLVALSHVDARTGALLDLEAVTDAAHRSGSWVLWDCSLSAGTMALDLDALGVDLAVGSLAHHLSGGPGAPAWSYARADLVGRLDPALRGGQGHADPDGQEGGEIVWRSLDSMARFTVDEAPLLSMVGALSGAQLVTGANLEEVREKSEQLTQLAVALSDAWLAPHGLQLVTPRRAERRAAHISLRHPDAGRMAALGVERLGVIVDTVEPDLLRIGLSPLPLRFVDLVVAMRRLRDGIASGQHTR